MAFSLMRIPSDVWHELFSGHKGAGPPIYLSAAIWGWALGHIEYGGHASVWAVLAAGMLAEALPMGVG